MITLLSSHLNFIKSEIFGSENDCIYQSFQMWKLNIDFVQNSRVLI